MSTYENESGIAHISLDDGKVNALGSASIAHVNGELDRAVEEDAAAVILSGRTGIFSAGFDLKELQSGDTAREALRLRLIDLVLRVFTFDRPVVVACTGHALAAGAALLLAADRRVGLDGPFRLGFNEASLGVSISAVTVELARYRMPMPWFESLTTGDTFSPLAAQRAGLLDEVVSEGNQLADAARAVAEQLGRTPRPTFLEMRRLVRAPTTEVMRSARLGLSEGAEVEPPTRVSRASRS
jgi:enoyl-CoA hydratase